MVAQQRIELAFSSCPNDTFMFHGLVSGAVVVPGVSLQVWMEDIEALNERARGLRPEPPAQVTKVSAAALGELTDRYTVLASGAALGRGCGPLVLARANDPRIESLRDLARLKVAIPGHRTTANLLLRIFSPLFEPVSMRFDEIMGAVVRGEVDAGLVIHESRFTYADHDLRCVADLGTTWETSTGLPLPLGVIVAERSLPGERIDQIEAAIRASVELGFSEPSRSWAYVREHAQDMRQDVCRRHIALYVNDFSVELGEQGRAAIDALLERGRACGMLPRDVRSPWRI